jgi:hypothetical protein
MEFSRVLQGKRFAGIGLYLRQIRRKAPRTPDKAVITSNPGVVVGETVVGAVVTVVTGRVVIGTEVAGTEVPVTVGGIVVAVVTGRVVGTVPGVAGVISGLKFWRSIVTVSLPAQ